MNTAALSKIVHNLAYRGGDGLCGFVVVLLIVIVSSLVDLLGPALGGGCIRGHARTT